MRRKSYPLEILEKIRTTQRAAARQALRQLHVKLESAQIELQRARKAAIDHERARWRFETERAIPAQGCSGADLQREADYALGLSERESLLKEAVIQARSVCDRLRIEVDALLRALEQSHAALEAVERHREKFDAEQRKQRANEAESDRDDLNTVRR